MSGSNYPKELLKSIAEEIDMGMLCFLNPDTLEVEYVLKPPRSVARLVSLNEARGVNH